MKKSSPQSTDDGPRNKVHSLQSMVPNKDGQSHSLALFGLVLAGGKSSRMGVDKGLIEFYGVPQREYAFAMLTKFCQKVFLSCKSEKDIPKELNPLPDKFEIESPLNGILSAFHFNSRCAWLTVPVDMPLINEEVLRYLLQHRDPHKLATCFFDSDGENPEPLVALWETKAHPFLRAFYESGMTSPRNFLKQADVHMIAAPDSNILTNINSPEELKKFQDGYC